jgi:hypothetical protein
VVVGERLNITLEGPAMRRAFLTDRHDQAVRDPAEPGHQPSCVSLVAIGLVRPSAHVARLTQAQQIAF